jgi:hypothetical protein
VETVIIPVFRTEELALKVVGCGHPALSYRLVPPERVRRQEVGEADG